MSKKTMPEAGTEQKVQTRYDRRMEARRLQKQEDERQEKMTRIIGSVVGLLVVAALVISVAVSLYGRMSITRGTYVKIGDHSVSRLEYDYYFNSAVGTYGAYMGIDASMDLASQPYSEDLSVKDLFDQMAVDQLRQVKALTDAAAENGFTFDEDTDYATFQDNFKESASEAGVTVKEYYKQNFGAYATEKNMEPIIRDNLLAGAYYNRMTEDNAPTEDEITAHYEENRMEYDRVDYRSFFFKADLAEDASEEEISAAMEELEKKADAMADKRREGEDFEKLCLENASEEDKANYEESEDKEKDYSLAEGRHHTGSSSVFSDWLFEEDRKEGDVTVLKDEDSHRYYVVEFIKRYFDEADRETISDTLAGEKTGEQVAAMMEGYVINDVKGELTFLTVEPQEDSEESGTQDGADAGEAEEDTTDAPQTEEGSSGEGDASAQDNATAEEENAASGEDSAASSQDNAASGEDNTAPAE